MHVKTVQLKNFKRFTDLTIQDVPNTARLVVLTGPNGSGKSAIFEGFNQWRRDIGRWGLQDDAAYFPKSGQTQPESHTVAVEFHEEMPEPVEERRKIFYIRSAYRHEPDFTSSAISKQTPFSEESGATRLVDIEQRVSSNYERITALTLKEVYSSSNDDLKVKELREKLIGKLRSAMSLIFEDLMLESPGDPIEDGTFLFSKGSATRFHYKNLSGGEKAAFDLLLDFMVRLEYFNDTVICIDEPELHMGSKAQADLLRGLLELMPEHCQLWIATHSLGMMKQSLAEYETDNSRVAFLDMAEQDFDAAVALEPATPNRQFWKGILEVALDDMAGLVAPDQVFLCESAADFDADIFRIIFDPSMPNIEWISVGNDRAVIQGGGGAERAIEVVAPGCKIQKVVDRDERSDAEVESLTAAGVIVLGRRNIEAYLLGDEVLTKLCTEAGHPDKANELLEERDRVVAERVAAGRSVPGDLKLAAGDVKTFANRSLGIRNAGNTSAEFMKNALAPLITAETETYTDLRATLFPSA